MDKDGSRRSRVTRTPGENQCVRCHHLFEEPFSKFNVEVEPAYNRFPGTAVAHFFSHAYDETWRCAPPGTGRLGPRTIPRKLTSGIRVVSAEKARSRPCFVCFPAEQRDQYVHFPSKRPQFKAGPSGLQLLDAVESSTIDDLMLDPSEHPVVSDGTQPPPPPPPPSPQHQQPRRSGSPLGGCSESERAACGTHGNADNGAGAVAGNKNASRSGSPLGGRSGPTPPGGGTITYSPI